MVAHVLAETHSDRSQQPLDSLHKQITSGKFSTSFAERLACDTQVNIGLRSHSNIVKSYHRNAGKHHVIAGINVI